MRQSKHTKKWVTVPECAAHVGVQVLNFKDSTLLKAFDDNQEITADNASMHRKVAAAKREKWLALHGRAAHSKPASQRSRRAIGVR